MSWSGNCSSSGSKAPSSGVSEQWARLFGAFADSQAGRAYLCTALTPVLHHLCHCWQPEANTSDSRVSSLCMSQTNPFWIPYPPSGFLKPHELPPLPTVYMQHSACLLVCLPKTGPCTYIHVRKHTMFASCFEPHTLCFLQACALNRDQATA